MKLSRLIAVILFAVVLVGYALIVKSKSDLNIEDKPLVTESPALKPNLRDTLNEPEPIAIYKNGKIQDFYKYLNKEVISGLYDCSKAGNDTPPTKLRMIFYINESGRVTNIDFPSDNLSENCKIWLKNKLLTMKGWQAPLVSGRPVKSIYPCYISCIMWQE